MNYHLLRDMIAARSKSFASLAFLVLLALGCQLYLSLWQRPGLEKAQVAWFAKRDALAKGETLADSTRYRNGVRDLEELEKRLVPKKEFAALLSQVYGTAEGNSVSLTKISYKPAFEKDRVGEILPYGISFTVSGKYASVKSFLADLVRYRELLTVDAVSLSSQSQTEESVTLNLDATVFLKTEGA